MKTIVLLTRREGAPSVQFERLKRSELLAAWAGIADGSVRSIHGLQEGSGAVLEMETETIDHVKRFVEGLPYVTENLLDVHYVPLKPFLGLQDLFATA